MPRNKKTRPARTKSTINRGTGSNVRPESQRSGAKNNERPLFLVEPDTNLLENVDAVVESRNSSGSETTGSSGSSFEEIWNIAKDFDPETKTESSRKPDMKIAYVLGIILGVALLVIFGRKGRGSSN